MVDIAAPPGTGWASDAGPYVQALRTVDGFRVEVSSNQFLDGDNQLTPDQEAALVTSGWEAPAPEPNSTSPNWWRDEFTADAAHAQILDVLRTILRLDADSVSVRIVHPESSRELPDALDTAGLISGTNAPDTWLVGDGMGQADDASSASEEPIEGYDIVKQAQWPSHPLLRELTHGSDLDTDSYIILAGASADVLAAFEHVVMQSRVPGGPWKVEEPDRDGYFPTCGFSQLHWYDDLHWCPGLQYRALVPKAPGL